MSKKLVSIVIPCYNEEEVIQETIKRLHKLCDNITEFDTELVFVDDGSRDQTRHLLKQAADQNSRVRVVGFARNFGHQIAVTAGCDAAQGDAVVLIDADLQDPPEVVLEMIEQWKSGFDVIYGTRAEREGESAFKLATARWFYRLLNKMSEVPIPLDTGDFRLMDRKVVNVLKSMPERDRFVRGMVSWVGFKQMALPYKRAKRFAGTSKYPLRKMLKFATDGILSFSSKPLQFSTGLGFISVGLALLGIVYVLIMRIATNVWVEGWTAIMLTVLFFGGVQLFCVGILGEYIGRIYGEVKNRPLYIVQERFGYANPSSENTSNPS